MSSNAAFNEELFRFLRELAANNNRAWFVENRPRYLAAVADPAARFIEAMASHLISVSPHFRADPRRQGGSMMRIYRDTRFAKDKTPYKLNLGIQFRHEAGRDVHAPGFYVHIEPGACFLAAGIWRPASPALLQIREFISDNPAAWRRALNDEHFAARYQLSGESLKRPPRGFQADHPQIEDLKRKDFIAIHPIADEDVLGPGFADRATEAFMGARPLARLLCAALDVPF